MAYWSFEGNGQDSIGHHDLTTDETGNLNYAEGKVGLAMSQTGNVHSFQSPAIAGINFNKDFTLSVWLYRERSIYDNDAVFDNGPIYLAKRDAPPWNSRMGVYLNTIDNRSIDLVDNSGMGQPPLHTWFHVLVFRRGNTVGIKVNNAGTATVDVSNVRFQTGSTLYVGRQRAGYPWQGRMDELGLWNRALTTNEMSALYNNGNGRSMMLNSTTATSAPAVSAVAAAPKLAFGPVVERVVPDSTREHGYALNFETGGLLTPPSDVSLRMLSDGVAMDMAPWNWARKYGGDLLAMPDGGVRFIEGVVARQTDEAHLMTWDEFTPQQVLADVSLLLKNPAVRLDGGWPQYYTVTDRAPLAMAFTTRNHQKGVLQILGNSDNPPGVKIRYKLVHECSAAFTNSLIARALEKRAARDEFQFRWVAAEDDTHSPVDALPDVGAGAGQLPLRVLRDVVLSSMDVESAGFSQYQTEQKQLEVFLTPRGGEKFAQATAENIGRRLAIVWRGQVISAPNIQSAISGRRVAINGRFTDAEAQQLLDVLNHREPTKAATTKAAQQQEQFVGRMHTMRQFLIGLAMYQDAHTNQWPDTLEQMFPYLKNISPEQMTATAAAFRYQRPESNLDANAAATTPMLFEKQPVRAGGQYLGYADGHVAFNSTNEGKATVLPGATGKPVQNDGAPEEQDSMLARQPPVVVETFPVSGARAVEPGEVELRVRFSKPMSEGSWSWSTAWEDSTPESVGSPNYLDDHRTCAMKVRLEPGKTYGWWLNSDQFKNFRDRAGQPAVPYLLIFHTKSN